MEWKERKPRLENVNPGFGHSFKIMQFSDQDENSASWHFHPEYEIVYISNGQGKRQVGQHLSYFKDGELIFLGPHLPHMGFSPSVKEKHTEVVVQMREDFLGEAFFEKPEMGTIKRLFEKSRKGIVFHGETKHKIGQKLVDVVKKDRFHRLIELLMILEELAKSQEFELLNANGFAIEVNSSDLDRMRIVYQYVEENFHRVISLDEISEELSMTTPAFCRFFKKATKKTFTQFVNEYRISKACDLLTKDHQTIAAIGFDCGFNNLSHFNKHFKLVTGMSPSEFRKNMNQVVE